MPGERSPSILTYALGDLTVTVLNDGWFAGALGLATRIPEDEAAALQQAAFRSREPVITVNAFLVTGPGRKPVLIDSGYGEFRPADTLGRLGRALAAAAVAPDEIETVLVTHLHPDHIGGLRDATGKAAFPNAELVVHADEAAHWLPDEALSRAPDGAKPFFENARAVTGAYSGRLREHRGGEVVPGITAVPLPGHTPGHCGMRIVSGNRALLIWTDVIHMPAIQFRRPEVGIVFDADGDQARATRARVLDEAAADRTLVAGSHLEFPALGYVAREGAAFGFVPEAWAAAEQ